MNFVQELLKLNRDLAQTDEERAYASETEDIYLRAVAWKRLVKACPHNGGWVHLSFVPGPELIQCESCGMVAPTSSWLTLVKWPETKEPAEAMGTALAEWNAGT